ncbi:aspartate carbamoyltransferase regulatory subunit [Buchnera aphidicola]|uniref:Aspartate carbamoyltransferase regulatory chain n=1 Tax=Buchnera aphidicola (Aphis gossypii) TaxID=98785 RepID=A0A5J6Z9W1_9GAMM|nr:aspartate carbamoyltransferase regulatory subunit [Buchnera aphidicola]QFQ32192.1 aspartate carbamoyltransferase regulatory subunit [Buchnera aphidicola (Aphis gossypii)]UPT14718.1 aspartate carbamoyltransferase regulatory subunit [Buchnera aphidicola (Aphis gossypii)]
MQINKLQVEAIKCGSVIDHIPSQIGFKLLSLFRFTETEKRITIGLNLPSQKLGRKDIIKIENTFLSADQINQLAIYAPCATVNYIDQYNLVGKIFPKLPKKIDRILICPNSNCITHDNLINSSFIFVKKLDKNMNLKCKYCEKEFSKNIVLS